MTRTVSTLDAARRWEQRAADIALRACVQHGRDSAEYDEANRRWLRARDEARDAERAERKVHE